MVSGRLERRRKRQGAATCTPIFGETHCGGVSVFCNVSIAEDVDKTWKASICAMDLCISAESKTDLSVKRLQKNVYDRETQICSGRAQVDA